MGTKTYTITASPDYYLVKLFGDCDVFGAREFHRDMTALLEEKLLHVVLHYAWIKSALKTLIPPKPIRSPDITIGAA